ncbi:hypothetical protein SESBI_25644 [Sesbania bispinosa]|nr:hypothetical protein SESBI_25644 [Sesbania bispinosa]
MELRVCKFTWFGNPRNGMVTKEKLDRVLVNWPWRSLFQNALSMALPPTSFDHSPIVLWYEPKSSHPTQFKYEAFWEENEGCQDTIKEGWVANTSDDSP